MYGVLFVRAGGVILALALFAGCSPAQTPAQATPTPLPTAVAPVKPTYTVQRGEVIQKLEFSGRIAPAVEEGLFFRTGGRVRNVYAKRNAPVKAGQVLADLEVLDDLERRHESQALNVRRAEINLEIAQHELNLFKANNPAWLSDYPDRLAIQEAQLELAQIALREASLGQEDLEVAIAAAQVAAPFDGVLTSFALSADSVVEAFAPVAVVADMSRLEISANIPAADATKLEAGMPVSVTLVSRPSQALAGEVRRLPASAGGSRIDVKEKDQSTRIVLSAPAEEAGYQPGDLIRGSIVLERRPDALWLPPQAVRTFEGRRFVVVQDGAAQRRVDVRLGIQGEGRVEILEGLEEGQVIVSP